MLTIEIRFPAGRYHATPWESHVNEGAIEWPPSPWRLLRALLATGYTKLHWAGADPPDDARSLVEKLTTTVPRYLLPRASGAHSRHYMPLGILDKGREKTTLVLDTWATIEDESLLVEWDVDLSSVEREVLENLLRSLGYLGRSESWVQASLRDSGLAASNGHLVVASDVSQNPGRGWEQISLLAPIPGAEYLEWRAAAVREALSGLAEKKRLTKAEQKKVTQVEKDFPRDVIACLQAETGWLRKTGWSQPPGTRRVLYWRRTDALEVVVSSRPRRVPSTPVEAMLLSIKTDSGNDHALPPVTRTLPQAELLHRAIVAVLSRRGDRSNVLSGRDDEGNPLQTAHRHAHVLPLDLDDDGHLEHILIWAPMGLDGVAQEAVRAVRKTFTKGGLAPLRLALAAEGDVADIAMAFQGLMGHNLRAVTGEGPLWQSRTPFVPPRFLKKSGRNALAGQVATECEARGFPAPLEVRITRPRDSIPAVRHRHFVRKRRRGPTPPVDAAYSLEIRFDQPVSGLVALGYGSHFGLGLFEVIDAT